MAHIQVLISIYAYTHPNVKSKYLIHRNKQISTITKVRRKEEEQKLFDIIKYNLLEKKVLLEVLEGGEISKTKVVI